jgi:hypothetical protein
LVNDDDGSGTLANGRPTGSVWIKTTEPNSGARWIAKKWNSATETWVTSNAPIYASGHAALYYLDRSGGGANIAANELYVQTNALEDSRYDAHQKQQHSVFGNEQYQQTLELKSLRRQSQLQKLATAT